MLFYELYCRRKRYKMNRLQFIYFKEYHMNLYPSIADHTSTTMIDERKAFALCKNLIAEGHMACISSTVILGTHYYTVCWND